MNFRLPIRLRSSKLNSVAAMAEEVSSSSPAAAAATATAASPAATSRSSTRSLWPSVLRWIPTSTDHIIASEKRLLSIVRTPYTQEQVNIGSGPPGSKVRWFRSASDEPRFINTVTFDSKEGSPTLVMIHGYGASQGFFFRNFDALAKHFRVIAIDQLGWGGSSRPDFTCKSTEETEAWFIDSFEEWRKAKNLSNFILLGHSFGGYVAARYALKYPEHIKHLILVGSAGFSTETDARSERLIRFSQTWKGAVLKHLWESNFTPQKIIRGVGPFGPDLVRKYTSARFVAYSTGQALTEDETRLLTDYVYHTLAAKASGELCLKHIFAFGAFARVPLLKSASEWKVPTTCIYGYDDWMSYEGAQEARKLMKIPCEILRVPQAGHFVFIDNPSGFHAAVLHGCRKFLSGDHISKSLPQGLTSA
ncbi:probable 1-acylglycerol-3-phosphate O-acyltransferase [Diospyros lotus]|uniref:probable 1-acylglycerol-3-phosphate O-acyltransferase n=1 Tax=Diospyros lotus TaxID=55363 RepID=UPI0022582BBD|nr:probable 1-acylglycerol-3-phosphate O-acyltransferase [Diospyros lotus]XP_052201597.1 probable 1-acylglycerol-3-phosphate O-acyltransferase [Diospyros lotus]